VEKQKPYRAGVWVVQPEDLKIAATRNEEGIAFFLKCREADHWPTGFENEMMLEPFAGKN
jgi:hypothetical protein